LLPSNCNDHNTYRIFNRVSRAIHRVIIAPQELIRTEEASLAEQRSVGKLAAPTPALQLHILKERFGSTTQY
jgi:hypothetical protein